MYRLCSSSALPLVRAKVDACACSTRISMRTCFNLRESAVLVWSRGRFLGGLFKQHERTDADSRMTIALFWYRVSHHPQYPLPRSLITGPSWWNHGRGYHTLFTHPALSTLRSGLLCMPATYVACYPPPSPRADSARLPRLVHTPSAHTATTISTSMSFTPAFRNNLTYSDPLHLSPSWA